jgi:tryptophan-rich hypothetical protein
MNHMKPQGHHKHRINPRKLLLSKWTAITPLQREKHFLVSKVIMPPDPEAPIEWIELEAVLSKNIYSMHWRELQDTSRWKMGWQ